jgi:cold shock CspA family protein
MHEKGIDVWLALEAFELAFYKRFNVLVLIASDGDYVPLVRKLNTLGTRVMVLGWDFEYNNETGQKLITRTSQDLLEEVTYPVQMSQIIDDRVRQKEPIINNLFVPSEPRRITTKQANAVAEKSSLKSEVLTLKNGFGFIKYPPNNLYFHYSNVMETDFNDLQVGDKVEFYLDKNEKGEDIAIKVKLT